MSKKVEEKVENPEEHEPKQERLSTKWYKNPLNIILAVVSFAVLIPLLYIGYIYAISPEAIRNPSFDHYHFRMQVIVDGNAENFGDPKYQQEYSKDLCTADLTESPIHFHDNKNQFVHIHWNGMTGGLVMKHYGWNYVGGIDSALGYQEKGKINYEKVPIMGNLLPSVPKGDNFYVFIGDEKGYVEKSFDDWKSQDLEKFFGKESSVPSSSDPITSFLNNTFFPKASAHGGVDDGHEIEPGEETHEEKLSRINNLLGNVVIFVQKDKPTASQIQDKFSHLEPLSESTCGG